MPDPAPRTPPPPELVAEWRSRAAALLRDLARRVGALPPTHAELEEDFARAAALWAQVERRQDARERALERRGGYD